MAETQLLVTEIIYLTAHLTHLVENVHIIFTGNLLAHVALTAHTNHTSIFLTVYRHIPLFRNQPENVCPKKQLSVYINISNKHCKQLLITSTEIK